LYTLTNSINWASPYIQYSPLTAGIGFEPAASSANMIRNSILNAPMTWSWNRKEITTGAGTTLTPGVQDYTISVTDFGFLEIVSLQDPDTGDIIQLKDVYNTGALSVSNPNFRQQPNAASVIMNNQGVNFKVRFLGVPDKAYLATYTYQVAAPLFGPFSVTSVGSASGGNTVYNGSFSPSSFPVGAIATIIGSTASANNGSFVIVSSTATTLTLANAAGVGESESNAFALNLSWSPIPDQYSDIYNNLFLSEAFSDIDDARAQIYRQRGVAAFLSKAEGLNQTQKNAFIQQWLARNVENTASLLMLQQAIQGRGI
jgi:hypothetical protein